MIKVCHMTSVHAPEDVRIFRKECVSLAKAGYDTYLVEQGETYDKSGVHIIGVGAQEGNRLARMLKMSKRVYEAARKIDADVYHFHDPELLPYGLKLKKQGKKVIFDSHENTAVSIKEKHYIPKILRNLLFIVYRKYEESVCRKLDAVIYVTPNLKDDFTRLNDDIVYLPNYPIVDEQNYREPYGTSNRLVFAGMITPTWSHDSVIKAIEAIEDVEYTLFGGVSESYLNQLKALPGWSKVRYGGKIPHEQVAEELRNGFVGVALMQPHLNSMGHQGTLGNTKFFEAMMAGLPVLCTDFELWKPIIEGNRCGICVDPNNVDEIREAIRFFLNNREEAIQMGRRGRETIIRSYNWSVEEPDLYALYQRVTGSGGENANSEK